MDEEVRKAYGFLDKAMTASRELSAALVGIDYREVAAEIVIGDENEEMTKLARSIVQVADQFRPDMGVI